MSKKKAKKQTTEQVVRKWEDLTDLRNTIIEEVLTPHTYLYGLYEKNKELIDKDVELTKLVKGLDENFKDIIEEVKEISSNHCTIEDGKHNPRTGVIKNDDVDNILTYDDIYGKYTLLGHKVIENGQKGLLNLSVTLAEKNNDFETAVIINKAKEEIDEAMGPLNLFKNQMDAINGKFKIVETKEESK